MSNIKSVYTTIAAFTPTGVTTTRNIDAVQLAVENADLPCRLLLPSVNAEGDDLFVMMGSLQNVGWAIRDVCLWAPLGSGAGVEQYSEAMLDYIISYLAELKGSRNPAAGCTIKGVEIQMGPVPWGNKKDYWAVDITVTVEEIL